MNKLAIPLTTPKETSTKELIVHLPYTLLDWAMCQKELNIELWEDREGATGWILVPPKENGHLFTTFIYHRLDGEILEERKVKKEEVLFKVRYPKDSETSDLEPDPYDEDGDQDLEHDGMEPDDFCEAEYYF